MGYLANRLTDAYYLGFFATPAALSSAYPTGADGYFAIVGSTDTIWTWDSGTSAWVDSEASSMVYPGAGIPISTGVAWGTSITPSAGFLKYNGSAYVWDNSTYLTSISGLNISLLNNNSGYITSAALSGYATESWVTTQGYLTSLSGAVLTSQATPQTIGATGQRLTKLWATDITVTNAITGSVTGNAGNIQLLGSSTGYTTFSTANAGATNYTLALPLANDTLVGKATTDTLTNKSIGAGKLTLEENASIALDPAGSADGKYTGITVTGVAGATVAFGDLITLDKDDSRWELVDISAAAAATGDARGILGMAVSAGNDGDTITILLEGIIRADANFPTLTIGANVYASTTGDIVVTQPTTTDYVIRIVGGALTDSEIFFRPDFSWTTHV